MATASIAARAGRLCLSTGATVSSTDAQAEARNIRFRLREDRIDATSNDSSGWNETITGERSFSATFESLYIPSSATNAHGIVDAIISNYALAFRFFPSTSTTGTYNYTGSVAVTDYELGGDSKGLWLNNGTLQGTGAITYSTST